MLTITGGKWTTYRKMGEDVINTAIQAHRLTADRSVTATLKLVGADRSFVPSHKEVHSESRFESLSLYGDEEPALRSLIVDNPELGRPLVEGYSYTRAEVVWGIRHEMARSVEDLLYRRTRLGLLDSTAAQAAEPIVQELLRDEGVSHGL